MMKATYCRARVWAYCLCVAMFAGLSAGCGSAFSEILFQAASAVGRSALDVALTDIANDFADAGDAQADEPVDGGGDVPDDETPDAPDEPPIDGGGADLVGDPVAGEPFYTTNGCSSCHCDDASGGCALDAPNAVGVEFSILEAHLTGDESHPVKLDLTAQDLADLQAYLASLGG